MKPQRNYNDTELTSFGNYVLSDYRKKMISEPNMPVTHADFKNWEYFKEKGFTSTKYSSFDAYLKILKK